MEDVIGSEELYRYLTQEQANLALDWYRRHTRHVDAVMKDGRAVDFPPEKEDAGLAELWKGGSWRWFHKNRVRGNIGGIEVEGLGY